MPACGHILWDWNGTLFDDAWLCRQILNELLSARAKPTVDHERYQEVFGFPVKDYYRKVGFDFSAEPFEKPAREFIARYEARRLECSMRREARDVLESICEAGIKQSVLSAYEQSALEQIVEHFGVTEFFSCIRGLDNPYAAGKIDLGRQMILDLDLDPSSLVLVGDTTHDFEVARELGMGCVLVPGGHHSRARLESCGATVVESLADVPAALISSPS